MRFRGPALLLVLVCLVFNALDCNGAWLTSKQAKKCCATGHCSPSNRDSCCKDAPIGKTFAVAAYEKASIPMPLANAALPVVSILSLVNAQRELFFVDATGPPPPLISSTRALPLRI